VTGKARFGVGDWDAHIGDCEVTSPFPFSEVQRFIQTVFGENCWNEMEWRKLFALKARPNFPEVPLS
jgi:hypothetical protein